MKNKNIPAVIMLSAGAIASVCGIVNRFTFLNTLKITLIVLVIFYVIGLIVGKVITKINKEATDSYLIKQKDELEEKQDLLHEELDEAASEGIVSDETASEDNVNEVNID